MLRNGRLVAEMDVAEATDERLIREMVGVEHLASVTADRTGPVLPVPVFTASGLTAPGLGPISLSVNQGEVLGVAGLMGAGRSRLLHTIFGAIARTDGEMTLAGRPYAPRSPGDAVAAGVALVPEDRKQQSIIAIAPVRWNVTLGHSAGPHPARVLLAAGGEGARGRVRESDRGADGVDRAADRIAVGR